MLLPAVNAALNTTALVLILAGYYFIRKKDVQAHKRCMLSAFGVSGVFLICYLIHHAQVGSVKYAGPASLKTLYYSILIPHIPLAAVVVPLAIIAIRFALRGEVEKHRRVVRALLPIWVFVSVSGVAIYFMLYQL
jgi:putative membrane protein